MLFLDISDSAFVAIYSTNPKEQSVDAVFKAAIPDGVVSNGIIHDEKRLLQIVDDILSKSSFAGAGDEVALIVTDKQVFTKIFPLPSDIDREGVAKYVLNEARKFLPYEPTELENFYKVIEAASGNRIFYTAMSRATISHYAKFLKEKGLGLTALYSRSQAVYTLLKNGLKNGETLLYLDVSKKEFQYALFDEHGPLIINEKKYTTLTVTHVIELAAKLAIESGLPISRVVIGGEHSIGINLQKEENIESTKIQLLNDLLEELFPTIGTDIKTKDIPLVFLANALGAFFLIDNTATANFAKDLSAKEEPKESVPEAREKENLSEEIVPEPVASQEQDTPRVQSSYFMNNTDLVVNKQSALGKVFNKKILGFIFGIVAALVIAGIVFGSVKKGGSIPFMGKPTSTPTPTLVPTETPTPTINPSLKRADVKVSVENGTEKTGYAKDIATFLEEKGYKNVTKANADKTDYVQTVILIKKSKQEYQPLIISDLKEKTSNPTVEELDSTDKNDIIIILGSS